MSAEEEDEFEDALENLPVIMGSTRDQELTSSSFHSNGSMVRPQQLQQSVLPQTPVNKGTTSHTIGGLLDRTPLNMVAADPTMSARQERLNALRRRLRDEFGHSTRNTSSGDPETASLASDSTSLHSWHHSLLGGGSGVVVRASDSISTCASSAKGTFSPSTPASPPPSIPPPKLSSPVGISPEGVQMRMAPPPLPPRPPSIRLPDPVAVEVMARLAMADRDREDNDSILSGERTMIATAGGSASKSSVTATSPLCAVSPLIHSPPRPRSKSTKEELWKENEHRMSSSGQTRSAQSSAESVGVTVDKGESVSSGTITSVTLSSTMTSPPDSMQRRRGHAKTNSLDRGLTLAKSIKTGPFPPPSSKSNSLTRGQKGPDYSDGEEEERNNLADKVIQQLTTSVIGESAVIDDSPLRPSQLGAIPSCSSSSASSSVSSRDGGRRQRRDSDEVKREEGKRDKKRRDDRDKLSVVNESPEHTAPLPSKDGKRNSRGRILDEEEKNREMAVDVDEEHIQLKMMVSPLGRTRSSRSQSREKRYSSDGRHSPDTSYDPITRDVERRMSMKGHNQMGGDGEMRGDSHESISLAGSTLRAGAVVKEYASGFFKGVLSRARNVIHTGASSSKTAGESEMSDSESEMDEQSHADSASVSGRQSATGTQAGIVRPRNAKKGPFDFAELRIVQEMNNEHTGAVWCVKFSICGRLMATAGQDSIIRVWCVRSAQRYFSDMRDKYQQKRGSCASSNASFDAFDRTMADLESDIASSYKPPSSETGSCSLDDSSDDGDSTLFATKPFAVFKGHTADVLDLSWSKNYFILSSGMDRSVKLWHLSRSECLCCFQHVDFVTCVSFLPKDDRYFISGSLDGKLRMWHIPDKKVAVWNEVAVKFITALAFAKSGKFAVVGTYNGRCYFYSTDQLKYHTVVDVRSTRGKNARGHKVTGLAVHGDKLLVTSNDSRIRMYDVRDKALTCKFKGAQNERSQIRAQFSPDGKHIVCGSEDRFVYLWRTSDLPSSLSVRKDRNAQWERVRAHAQPVSVACFAPKPAIFLQLLARIEAVKRKGGNMDAYRNTAAWAAEQAASSFAVPQGDVLISADLSGCIKVMVNRAKPMKTGQSTFFPSREI